MVPDYISEKKMKEYKINKNGDGDCYPCMGCRSFLTPWTTKEDKSNSTIKHDPKYYGRFNQGVVTINLVDVGLAAEKALDKFWNVFEERLELCHKALQLRHERLSNTYSDTSQIHWQHGAIARLDKGESIHPLLHDGYSTISLGYAGLWECVYALIGKKLTEPEGEELGLAIMQKLNDKCKEWKDAENIDYSVYGTPIESVTYKFAKACQERYGIIDGVTDKNYITNSYHIHVTEPIDAFDKLATEAKFQKLSPGGAISYVEVPNLQNNIPAVLSVIKFIYDNIMYAELNTKSDYCQVCGYEGEIVIKEDKSTGKLYWQCPNCENTEQSKMNVARRTCGYIGTQYWNQGRTQEIKERVLHLGED
jgi:ribonucleoside-triphosphate reductase